MRIARLLTTIDTHTAGGPTRTITGGLPPLPPGSVTAKMSYFSENHDDVRRLLMLEPRGHAGMFGAVLTEPSSDGADLGMFFMTSSGYLGACIHSTIGAVTAGLETGFIRPPSGGFLTVEVPAGVVSVTPRLRHGTPQSLVVRTPPAFVCDALPDGLVGSGSAQIVFSGALFLLVDWDTYRAAAPGGTTALPGLTASAAPLLRTEALRLLRAADGAGATVHGRGGKLSIAYVLLYERVAEGRARSLVVSRSGAMDRSPCGAGTAALATSMSAAGTVADGGDLVNESVLGMQFTARVVATTDMNGRPAMIPEVEGAAWVTGMHSFILDERDPVPLGFHIPEVSA